MEINNDPSMAFLSCLPNLPLVVTWTAEFPPDHDWMFDFLSLQTTREIETQIWMLHRRTASECVADTRLGPLWVASVEVGDKRLPAS